MNGTLVITKIITYLDYSYSDVAFNLSHTDTHGHL